LSLLYEKERLNSRSFKMLTPKHTMPRMALLFKCTKTIFTIATI